MTHRCIVTLAVALCVAFVCATAYAADETEVTGGFVPVISGSGEEDGGGDGGDSGSKGSDPQDGGNGGDEGAGDFADGGTSDADSSGAGTEQPGGAPSGAEAEPSGDGSVPADASNPEFSRDESAANGIRLDDGSTVTVDDGGRLVHVSPGGDARVLDQSRTYALDPSASGTVVIRDEAGNEVEAEGTVVRFVDADGNRVAVDTANDGDAAGASSGNETEMSADTEQASAANQPSDAESGVPVAAFVIAILAAAVAVVGIVLWKRRKQGTG